MSDVRRVSGRRRLVLVSLNAGFVLVLLLAVRRGVNAAMALPRAQERAEEMSVGAESRNRPLEGMSARVVGDPAGARVELSSLDDAVVLVFDAACVPCAGNQWNWTNLLREARGSGARVVALTLEPAKGAEEYWKPWPDVQVLAADTATLRDELKLLSTPATLVVRDGMVRRAYRGPLSAPATEQLAAFLRGGGR